MDRVLLTTAYIPEKKYYDYVESNVSGAFLRGSGIRRISMGLRFIKQNVPEVEILEYPTREEYLRKLEEGWDVVGFSFYMNETQEILEMVGQARRSGVEEIWGGNYGILTKPIQGYFDRIFIGYSEFEIAKLLGKDIEKLIHPPLISVSGTPFGVKSSRYGALFTSRGCGVGCKFCQTPSFCPTPSKIPIESIERVLKYYREIGIRYVFILDENFGILRKHTEEVVHLLGKYGFGWSPMVRADVLMRRMEDWREMGLRGALIGIESINQEHLDAMGKKERAEEIIDLIEKISILRRDWRHPRNRMGGVCYYMMGYEDETEDSIKATVEKLKKVNPGLYQVCVLTPFPQTPLWEYLDEKYGIFEKDWHKFDAKHLVWNHPNISPEEMERLLHWAMKELNAGHFTRDFFPRMSIHLRRFRSWFREICLANIANPTEQIFFQA